MTKIAAGQKFTTVASTVDITEKKSASQNALTEVYTIEDVRETVLGTPDEILYTEVAVSSAEILTLGSVGKTILPAPGAGKYYDFSEVIIEYKHNSAQYNLSDYIVLGVDHITANLIKFAQDNAIKSTPFSSKTWDAVEGKLVEFGYGFTGCVNAQVDMYTYLGTDPTGGDGTMLVKIWYKVRTIGSEL